MRICPVCQTTYVDDSLRFCMKDGNALEQIEEPTAAATMEEEPTVFAGQNSPKMVVPLDQPQQNASTPPPPPVSPTPAPSASQPQRKSNAGILIALAVLGVVALLGIGGFGAWFLFGRSSRPEIGQTNTSPNLNQNVNSSGSVNSSLNANLNANGNANLNTNANLKTPTPTPTRTPTPTPTPNRNANVNNANANINTNANVAVPNANARITPTPIVVSTPTPKPVPSTIAGGVVNGKASNLPKPAYPQAARAIRASGVVNVQVLIDEDGRVVSAQAVSGHPLLRNAAESAARQARFQPTILSGQPVKVSGTLVYNFKID